MPEREGYRVGGIQGQGLPGFNTGGTLRGLLTPNPLQVGQPRLDFSLPDTFQAGQTFPGLNTLASQPDTDESGNTNWAKLFALGLGGIAGAALGGREGALTGLATATGFLQGQRVEGERLADKAATVARQEEKRTTQNKAQRKTQVLNTAHLFLENEDLDGLKTFADEMEVEDPEMSQLLRAVHSGAVTKFEKTENQKIFDHSVAAIKSSIQAGNIEAANAALAQLQLVDPGVAKVYRGLIGGLKAPGPSTENLEDYETAAREFLQNGNVKEAEVYIQGLEIMGGPGKAKAQILRDKMNVLIQESITDGFEDPEERERWNRLGVEEQKKVRLSSEIIEGIDQFRLVLLDPRVAAEIGKLPSLTRELDNWVTGGALTPPEVVAARTILRNSIDLMLRGRTGAAIGEKEEAMYNSLFGDADMSIEVLRERVKELRASNKRSIRAVLGDIPLSRFDYEDKNKGLVDAIRDRDLSQLGRILASPNTPKYLNQPLQEFLGISDEGAESKALVHTIHDAISRGAIGRLEASKLIQTVLKNPASPEAETALEKLEGLGLVPGLPDIDPTLSPTPPLRSKTNMSPLPGIFHPGLKPFSGAHQ